MKNPFQLNIDYSKRILGLDYIRGVAAILVVFAHTAPILWPVPIFQKYMFEIFFGMGFITLEAFFVLSGFLIGRILIKTLAASENFGFKNLYQFWIRRWFRTLPNYYLFLLLNFLFYVIAKGWGSIKPEYSLYLIFSQTLGLDRHPAFYGESWSLALEEWFYLTFPLFLLLIYKLLGKARSLNLKVYVSTIVFLIACTLLRVYLVGEYNVDWDITRKHVFSRLDAIVSGVLGAYIFYFYPKLWGQNKIVKLVVGVVVLVLCHIFLFSSLNDDFSMAQMIMKPELITSSFFAQTLLFNLFHLGLLLTFPFFNSIKKAKLNPVDKIITFFSVISYSLYLIHLLVINIFRVFFVPTTQSIAWPMFIGVWLVAVLLASINYKIFERPMTNLRNRFKSDHIEQI